MMRWVEGVEDLLDAVEVLKGVEGISFVKFDDRDVVRHPLVQRIVRAYEQYNEANGVGRQMSLKLTENPLDAAVNAVAAAIVANSPNAVRECKQLVVDLADKEIDQSLISDTADRIARIRASDEGREGVRSFLEKSKPSWLV